MSASGIVNRDVTECHVAGAVQLDCSVGSAVVEGDTVAVFGLGGDCQPVSVHESGVDLDRGRAQVVGSLFKSQGDVAARAAGLNALNGVCKAFVLAVRADIVCAGGGRAAAERNPTQRVVIHRLVHNIVRHLYPDGHRVVGVHSVYVGAERYRVDEVAGQVAGVFFRALVHAVERPVQLRRLQIVQPLVLEAHLHALRVGDRDPSRLVNRIHGDGVAVEAARIFHVESGVGLGIVAEGVSPDDIVLDACAEILLRDGGRPHRVARRGLHFDGVMLALAAV